MDTVIAALTSAVEISGTAIVALIVVIAILRGSRNIDPALKCCYAAA